MKIYDILLNFVIGYLPSIMSIFLVSYVFQSIFLRETNSYAFWFCTFCIAVSNSINIYKYRNRSIKKPASNEIYENISVKDWTYLLLYACMSLGGFYMLCCLKNFSEGYVKNILVSIGLIILFFGTQYFFEKVKTLKLIDKCKHLFKKLNKKAL